LEVPFSHNSSREISYFIIQSRQNLTHGSSHQAIAILILHHNNVLTFTSRKRGKVDRNSTNDCDARARSFHKDQNRGDWIAPSARTHSDSRVLEDEWGCSFMERYNSHQYDSDRVARARSFHKDQNQERDLIAPGTRTHPNSRDSEDKWGHSFTESYIQQPPIRL
jgi:hypothetical protein